MKFKAVLMLCGHEFLYRGERPEPKEKLFCRKCDNWITQRNTAPKVRNRKPMRRLTKEERALAVAEAKNLLAEGHTPKEIARAMGFAPATIRRWINE